MKYNLFKVKEIRDNGKERLTYYLLKDYSPTLNNYSYNSYINGDQKVVTYEEDVDFSSTKELKVYINNVLKKPLFYNGKRVNPKDFETKRGRELSSHNIDVNSERVSSYRPIFKVKEKEEEVIPKEEGKEDSSNKLVLKNLLLSSKFKNNYYFLSSSLRRFKIVNPISIFILTLNSFFTNTIKKSYKIKLTRTKGGIKLEEEEIKGTTLNSLKSLGQYSEEVNSIVDKELVEELYYYFISNLREE